MATPASLIRTTYEFENLQETYGLSLADRVEFPVPGAVITSPPSGKVNVYLKMLDACLRLALTEFQEELIFHNRCNIQMLNPNAIHKMVAFEMIYRANNIILDFFVFKYLFRFGATGDKYTLSAHRGGHSLVPDSNTPKNWLWVNQELLGREHHRANNFRTLPHSYFVTMKPLLTS